jgi:hypothetical protein
MPIDKNSRRVCIRYPLAEDHGMTWRLEDFNLRDTCTLEPASITTGKSGEGARFLRKSCPLELYANNKVVYWRSGKFVC